IRGLKVINGNKGYFVSMPSRKRTDGTHQDIAHPINNAMRKKIEDKVLTAYEQELRSQSGGSATIPTSTPMDSSVPAVDNYGGELPGQGL
ncbi:MAG: hypothetical protein GY869_09530, partial [Planctomycetes bacterium]|nr:hypothetical protein [Planctomycetota bacterium]